MTAGAGHARVIGTRRGALWSLIAVLRPHQWAKNPLVFAPLVAGHRLLEIDLVLASALTFVAYSLCASGIYILNDIVDIQADRQHPRKRRRPFAAGELGIPPGLVVACSLLAGGVLTALLAVSWKLAAVLGLYLAVTTAYTGVPPTSSP